jgi:surface antigen
MDDMEMHISNNIAVGQAQARTSVPPQSPQKLTELATKNAAMLKARTKKMNFALVTSQVAVVAFIVAIVAISYRAPVEATQSTGTQSILEQSSPSVDQVAAADVAASVAQSTNMLVSTNVASLAISLNSKTDLAQTDNSFISKPQIVSQNTGRKGVTYYVTKDGDNVQSVAASFGISEDTVRWANNMTSDSIKAGTTLKIPSITGVLYTVKSGDDAASLAQKYQADKDRIITFNDAELTGLQVGQQIIIPDGILPVNERPGYVAPRTYSSSSAATVSSVSSTFVSGNGYAYGYCTYYAYNRRAELGRPIGGNWGNAVSWAANARAQGFRVDHTPEAGAVFQTGGGWYGFGHVGVVERVEDNGNVFVSEMNYVGWNIVSNRTIPASSVGSYNYIH